MGSPCIYHLLPTGPPEPPIHCDTRNVTYSTVKVGIWATCRFTKKGKFTIKLLKMGESISVVMSRLYFPTRHKICYLSLSLLYPTPPPQKNKYKGDEKEKHFQSPKFVKSWSSLWGWFFRIRSAFVLSVQIYKYSVSKSFSGCMWGEVWQTLSRWWYKMVKVMVRGMVKDGFKAMVRVVEGRAWTLEFIY